ncbi:MAG: flavodoxin [Fusobacteriaceae bacterium]|jgi:flavodoxin I|nr:flavodoxin [Fusobacteriaceae bacterium]
MKKIGIFYGTNSGKSSAVAEEIEFYLKKEQVKLYDVKEGVEAVEDYENLIFVTPTYGVGELQPDWEARLPKLQNMDFKGKLVALAGLGNQLAFGESYLGGLRILYDAVVEGGAAIIGRTSPEGYVYKESFAVKDGLFVGLALDEDNESVKTPDRIKHWVSSILPLFRD